MQRRQPAAPPRSLTAHDYTDAQTHGQAVRRRPLRAPRAEGAVAPRRERRLRDWRLTARSGLMLSTDPRIAALGRNQRRKRGLGTLGRHAQLLWACLLLRGLGEDATCQERARLTGSTARAIDPIRCAQPEFASRESRSPVSVVQRKRPSPRPPAAPALALSPRERAPPARCPQREARRVRGHRTGPALPARHGPCPHAPHPLHRACGSAGAPSPGGRGPDVHETPWHGHPARGPQAGSLCHRSGRGISLCEDR